MIDFTDKVKQNGFWRCWSGGILVPTPAAWHIVRTAERIWMAHDVEDQTMVVTAFFNGLHARLSEHKQGNGVDIRTRNLPGGYVGQAAQDCCEELFDDLEGSATIILEPDHCHAHHEPGGGKLIFEV